MLNEIKTSIVFDINNYKLGLTLIDRLLDMEK